MKKRKRDKIKKKKESINVDIMDINWVVDHVTDVNQRIDVLEKLGYRIGKDPFKNKRINLKKSIVTGKRGELRIQVTGRIIHTNFYYCVILPN